MEIYAWSTIWNFYDLTRPQLPLTEKLLKFNMSFHDSVIFFSKHKNKVISPKIIEFKNMEDSDFLSSDFQALKTSVASAISLASTASKAQF